MNLKVFLVQEISMLYLIKKPNVFLFLLFCCWGIFFLFDCPQFPNSKAFTGMYLDIVIFYGF